MAQPNWFRTCVGCGQAKHKKELLKIVKCQDNHLEIEGDIPAPFEDDKGSPIIKESYAKIKDALQV